MVWLLQLKHSLNRCTDVGSRIRKNLIAFCIVRVSISKMQLFSVVYRFGEKA